MENIQKRTKIAFVCDLLMYLIQTKNFYDGDLKKLGFLEQLDTPKITSTCHRCFPSLEGYTRCLFKDLGINEQNLTYSAYRDMSSFRYFHNELKTVSERKLAMNRKDDKGVVLEDQIRTLAHGHYMTDEAELIVLKAEILKAEDV